MSLIQAIKLKVGMSITAANNFLWDASADNGTMKMVRGDGKDIFTVDSGGFVGFPQGLSEMPPGTLIDFCGTTAPAGFLACPLVATNISRTTYAALFAAIGTTWGAGDGSTTFGMPWFPEDYATVQANANVGTGHVGEVISHMHTGVTGGQNSQHTHNYARQDWGAGVQAGSSYTVGGPVTEASGGANQDHSHNFNTNSTGGTVNKAAGHRVLKCIKV